PCRVWRCVGVLEHQRLLQEDVGMFAAGKNEMAVEESAGFLEFVQNLFGVHFKSVFTCSFSVSSSPRTRSTDSTTVFTRNAPRMFCRCATSRTSMSTVNSKNSGLRLV